MDERVPLAGVFLISVAVGAVFLLSGLSAILDTDHPLETQTVSVSTTLTTESCPDAEIVGNGACNAKVTITDWSPFASAALGVFMMAIGIIDLLLLIAVSI